MDHKKIKGTTRLATAVTTSAMSLSLFSAIQSPLQAQDQRPPVAAPSNQLTDDQAAEKFFAFGYDYYDAKVLASFWRQRDVGQTKVSIGHKLWNLGQEQTDAVIREARGAEIKKGDDNAFAYYADSGYSYDDAEALAKHWGSKNVGESKLKIGELLIGGHYEVVDAALKSSRRR